jgi:hypothetical protein
VTVATADECRRALEVLAGRLSNLDPASRAAHLTDRSISCTVSDLGVTYATMLSEHGAGPVTEVGPGDPRANLRFSAESDDLLEIAADPGRFGRAWLTGRVKVDASLSDLFRLRKLL